MGKKDRDDERQSAAASPIQAATPKPQTVQRDAEKTVGVKHTPTQTTLPSATLPPQQPTRKGSRWGERAPESLSGTTGSHDGQKLDHRARSAPQEDRPGTGTEKPDPKPTTDPTPTGKQKGRSSNLTLQRDSPAGRTKDAATRKTNTASDTRTPEKSARPAGRTQDAPRKKPEVVCKAPPRGADTKPKGGGGSGKRFIPYEGSRYCK